MDKVLCITHSADLDGHSSAAIVKKKYPDAEIIGWNYGEKLPDVPSGRNIIMTDVSFPVEEMIKMAGNAESFTWIDHHAPKIKELLSYPKLKESNPLMEVVVPKEGENVSACELTWRYMFPDEKAPEAIRLLGAYDCFRHKDTDEEQEVLQFQFAMRAHFSNPEECAEIFNLTDKDIEQYKNVEGKAIYSYLKTEALATYNKGFVIDVHGHKFICLSGDKVNPINFGIDYHSDGYEGAAAFRYENDLWCFSIYNEDGSVDCSVIAKKLGGGGHVAASGFELENKVFNRFIESKRL